MGMGPYVCYFFLFGWVDFDVFVFCVLADDQTVVDLHSCSDEECSELLNFLEDVRSCNALTHADDCSFVVPPQRT